MLIANNPTLARLLDEQLDALVTYERLDPDTIRRAVDAGTMTLLANPAHANVTATLIGRPASIKVNANIGTSPMASTEDEEQDKLRAAEGAGAHAVMDLSTAGDLDRIRTAMLAATPLPLGTVPIYSAVAPVLDAGQDAAELDAEALINEIAKQAKQGVDFMTIHSGVTRQAALLAKERVLGIVSRGGSIMARWMAKNGRENPLTERFDEILDICREYNVTISLGDGLRPGAADDAGDEAQWHEVGTLAAQVRACRAAGVQAMVEGPGHMHAHRVAAQISTIKRMTHDAPLYVLGPLVTDCAPGYDHIGAAIGGTIAAINGADFLCYVTPAEHLSLPCVQDVHEGVMASRVAAQAAMSALGYEAAIERDRAMSDARAKLDWKGMEEAAMDPALLRHRRKDQGNERECSMCGRFCAIRMQEDIGR